MTWVTLFASILRQNTQQNFPDLAKSWALMILNVFLVYATVIASVVLTLMYVAYCKGDIQRSLECNGGCLVS